MTHISRCLVLLVSTILKCGGQTARAIFPPFFSTSLLCYLLVSIKKYRPNSHVLTSFLRIFPEFFLKTIFDYLLRPVAKRSRYDNYVQSVYKFHDQSSMCATLQLFTSTYLSEGCLCTAARFLLRLALPYVDCHKTKLEVISSGVDV